MSFVAVIGAGPIGGALTHKIAQRARVHEVRLIDSAVSVAQGKGLDILQSSPVEHFATRVTAAASIHAAAGAAAIVIADAAEGSGEHRGETGLQMLRQLTAVETTAPLVFGGADQGELMARAAEELHVARSRLIGTAASAFESAIRAMVGLAIDVTGVDVHLRVLGVPPKTAVIAWEGATVFGQPLASQLPPHAAAAVAARAPGLWPPAPYALASATTRVVEAIANGSRRQFTCFVVLDAGPRRSAVAAVPIVVGRRGVLKTIQPALSRQEQTLLENALEK
jgi:malate dehydrogenase